ncbi:hypothetical protein JCM6882_004345 [Rhodosporidiobolus microsporus]
MATVTVLSAMYGLLRSKESISSVRSPVLIPPTVDDPEGPPSAAIATSSPPPLFPLPSRREQAPLTEHALREAWESWLCRLRDLSERNAGLLSAKSNGLDSCWAGKTTDSHIQSVQRAADEAKWVEEKLRLAVVFCRREGVRKVPMKTVFGVGMRRTGTVPLRPAHSRFPPSLLDLPYPLPIAQEANIYKLVVELPPAIFSARYQRRPQERDEEREAQGRDAPPMYTEEADICAGERMVERSDLTGEGGEEEYSRALAGLLDEMAALQEQANSGH